MPNASERSARSSLLPPVRYLVTGAAGFIGSHLYEALISRDHEVLPLDCLTPYYAPECKLRNAAKVGATITERDLASEPLDDLLEGIDGIFHLAGQPGVRQSWGDDLAPYLRHNLLATERLATAAAARGTRLVFSSSSSVYGSAKQYPTPENAATRPVSPYGVTKLACEHLLAAHSDQQALDAVVLRYFTVYGPRQRPDMAFSRLLGALHAGRTFRMFGNGEATRSFTYVTDVVAATIEAMEKAAPGSLYNVGGGTEASLREVVDIVQEITGMKLDVEHCEPVSGDVVRTAADISKISREIGWIPAVDLRDGLIAQWEELGPATELHGDLGIEGPGARR